MDVDHLTSVVFMLLGYLSYALHIAAIAQFVYAIHRWDHRFQNHEKLGCRLKNLMHDRVELTYLAMSFSSITSLAFILILIPYYFDYSDALGNAYQITVALAHCMCGIAVNVWHTSAIMGFRKRDRVGGWDEAKHRYKAA